MSPSQRLRDISAEVGRLRTEAGILEEQVEFQSQVAEDARLRALVSETPLAERESREAGDDLARLQRSLEEALTRIESLRAEQDRLLDEMLAERGRNPADAGTGLD